MNGDYIVLILDSILILEFVAFMIAGFNVVKSKEEPKKWLFFYLGLTFIVEIIGFLMNKWGVESNQWLYNLYGLLGIWILFKVLALYAKASQKFIIFALMAMSYVAVIINALFFSENIIMQYWNYGFAVYSLLLSTAGLIILFSIMKSDKVLQIHRLFSFWVIIGMLFYNFCILPLAIIFNIYPDLYTSESLVILIQPFSSILMNACFIIGYLWSKEQNFNSSLY